MAGPDEALRPPLKKTLYLDRYGERSSILLKLINEDAQKVAKDLSAKGLKATQLRRFYEPVINLRQRALASSVAFDDVKAEMLMLKARAAYAWKRKTVPEPLVRFFTEHAHSVNDLDEFKAFCRHFEAVVAYHRAFSDE